jgi:hypothetical protein
VDVMSGWTRDEMLEWLQDYMERHTFADQLESVVEVYSQLNKACRPLSIETIYSQWSVDVPRHPSLVLIAFLQAPISAGTFIVDEQGRYQLGRIVSEETVSPLNISPAVRFQILKRDGYRCRLCGVAARSGEHVRLEVDHITPRAKGGGHDAENLWTLCFECNRGKGTKDL